MENQKKNLFDYKQMPWDELKAIGLTEESFLDLPANSIDRILTGNLSPLMKMKFVDNDGNALPLPQAMKFSQDADGVIPAKFRLTRDEQGNVHVQLLPKRDEINRMVGETEIPAVDIARMKDQESVLMTIKKDGKDEKCYLQLDNDLNVIQMTREKEVVIPNAIGDVTLGEQQIQQIRDGKPLELEVGDTKVTVGVDLNDRNGFRIVEGDMDEWKQKKLEQWDRITPGVRGYWQTSENGWEYRLHNQREEKLERTSTVERETGRRLSIEEDMNVSNTRTRGMRR